MCGGGIKYSDDAPETASVRLLPTGGAEVIVGTTPFGTGHATSWSQLVADVLGVPFADVRVIHGDTASAPHGYGSYGSRSLIVGGAAVHAAAVRTRRKATELAAEMLEASAGDLELVDGVFGVKGNAQRDGVARRRRAAVLPGRRRRGAGLGSVCGSKLDTETFPAGTHLAAVEVDTETGFVRVVRFVAVDDVGNVVNPLIVDGQIHGGVAQGIGEALYEEMAYDADGNLVTASFSELTIPAASDLPSFVTDRTCTPSPATPLGSKGVGEAGAIGSLPAIVNAVHDAVRHLGVRDLDVPCTPERVWRALPQRQRPPPGPSDWGPSAVGRGGPEAVELGPQHCGDLVGADLVEPRLDLRDLLAPLGRVDGERLLELLVGEVEALDVERLRRRHAADRRLDGGSRAIDALDDPLEHAAVLAEARPQEPAVVSSWRRNQLT